MFATALKSAFKFGAKAAPAICEIALPTTKGTNAAAWTAVKTTPTTNAQNNDEHNVDVWVLPTSRMAQFAMTQANLTEDEISHSRGLKRDEDRVRFIATRSLLRQALSHSARTEVESGQARLQINAFGKPELKTEDTALSFSITHAGAFSAIAITKGATIGIDAEKVEAERLSHLPFDCFSAKEQKHLKGQKTAKRHFDFFRLWTLKEAYTKALGLGFSAEFNKIDFDLDRTALNQKAAQANANDTESFDLVSVAFEGATYFLATCLLNAAKPMASIKKNVFVVG